MNEPQMKQQATITFKDKGASFIKLFADIETASAIKKFGLMVNITSDYYYMKIDSRYDFDEVVNWINETYPRKVD